MFTLAHLSDPHLAPLRRPRLFELAGKRALGHVNWRLRRRREHLLHVLDAVIDDMRRAMPDHTAVTGDLVNTAAAGEFAPARAFLDRLGPPEAVTFVPGNHDAYVRSSLAEVVRHWGPFMQGDGEDPVDARDPPRPVLAPVFPFVRRRGPLLLIGLSTAVPTGPLMAWGRLGAEQLAALGPLLAQGNAEGLFRVVLLHHPPLASEEDRYKRLTDRGALQAVLHRHGAELMLHGHNHIGSVGWIDGPAAPVPVVGVPSASALGRHDEPAGYNLYRISAQGTGWRCELVTRRWDEAGTRLVDGRHRLLHPAGG